MTALRKRPSGEDRDGAARNSPARSSRYREAIVRVVLYAYDTRSFFFREVIITAPANRRDVLYTAFFVFFLPTFKKVFAFRIIRYCHRPLAVGFFFANPNAAAAREYIERFLRVESVSCAAATLSYADRHLDAAADAAALSKRGEELFSAAGAARASSADVTATRNAPEPVELTPGGPGEPVSSAKLAFARALRGDNAGTAPETEPGFRFSR